ncbi:hypothetical protein EDC01DRAFT_779087 [Geopyxis carbonaria]|nr:hypothetical protein EDC01DRAFT_779087 [Geopyxis carbonaria]
MYDTNIHPLHLLLHRDQTPHLFRRASKSVEIGAPIGSLCAFFIVGGIVYTLLLMRADRQTLRMVVETDEDGVPIGSGQGQGRGGEVGLTQRGVQGEVRVPERARVAG